MIVAAVLAAGLLAQSPDRPARVIDRGGQSGIEEALRVAIASPEEFASIWRRHSARPVPAVDFTRETVVCIFLGTRPTAGYQVDIVSVSPTATATIVRYRERTPPRDALTAQVLTFPYVIASIPGAGLSIRFEQVQ